MVENFDGGMCNPTLLNCEKRLHIEPSKLSTFQLHKLYNRFYIVL